MYWTDTWNTCEGGTYIYIPIPDMSEKWKLVWLVVGCCPDMQHSSLSLCLKSLSQMAPLLLSQLASSTTLSTFSADIFSIVCMTPCMGWTQVDELAPLCQTHHLQRHSIFATLLEYFAWILVQNEFSSLTAIMFKLFPLLTNSTIFLSRDLGPHKTILFP